MKEPGYKKILLIGIDGTDPNIMNELMKKGLLPNFVRLKNMGDFVPLETSLPPQSPVAWTSISTGKNPGKHGVFDFIDRNPENYLPGFSILKSTSGISGTRYESVVKADPFWRITSKSKIPTTVIRWPVTFPPEKIKGNMLSGLGVPDVKGFLGGYTFYTTADFDPSEEGAEKIVKVPKGSVINTYISGPRKKEGKEIVDVRVPLQIVIAKDKSSATISIQGTEYPVKVGGWSDWVRIKFDAGIMKSVYGIFKAYLISTEPEFKMYITSVQFDPENPFLEISYPRGYSKELVKEIGLFNTLGQPEDTKALTEGRISDEVFLEQAMQIEEERDKMFWKEFKSFKESDKGVYAFVYDTSDKILHTSWDEKVLGEDDGKLSINKDVMDYFVKKDIFLGKVLEQLDNKTALFIFSDHGFTSFERAVSINTWLVENGFMSITKKPSETDDEGALFEYVDWGGTKAYSLGFNSIYINLEGREGNGIVKENEKDAVVGEIIEGLSDFIDNKTGKKPISRLYRKEEVYHGVHAENAPDIIIGFNPGYRMSWQNAIGGLTQEVITDNLKKWDGDHLVDPPFVPGVLFTNFRIKNRNPNQIDIAPTVLHLLGLKIPEDMDGKSLV